MFGNIDKTIFHDSCRVLEIVPLQHYVFPIFKNGSTSLGKTGYRTITIDQLKQLTNVDVFVRNPHERFLSGVQTYLSKLDKSLDKSTALYFVKNYLYLNRHYCPQLFWLINLQRFTKATITIRPLAEINTITNFTENTSTVNQDVIDYFANDDKIKFYNEIDEVLTVNLIGQTVTFKEIMSELSTKYSELYADVFDLPRELVNVVS